MSQKPSRFDHVTPVIVISKSAIKSHTAAGKFQLRRQLTAISKQRKIMNHMFFNNSNSISQNAAMHCSFVPASHNLGVMPNAINDGMPVEADDDGIIVAVKFPDGHAVRNNFHYIIHQTPTENLLIDKMQIAHPLD